MSTAYWLGLATPIIACAGLALGVLVVRGVLSIASLTMKAVGKTDAAHRRHMASTVFGAKRYWFLAGGDFAVILIRGLDHEERKAAEQRLRPPLKKFDSASHFAALKHPRPKGDA